MPKARKVPADTPDRGDRCRLRANAGIVGTLKKFDPDSNWATVEWDGPPGPKLVHRFELQLLKD